ncbi:DNA-binding protein rap1 [Neolecta irregularis DAH-3]|uniref:DNA-binding protein RAP1 n=1 Tax=Neolecta irregularis (strain DAH-3) TaxID=1198029 RepID=A0A1U7LW63_NEOID|nr:DNA-binding protein rap1 [Neolecta irregularis DAH-3]|eukprot:OLL26907.1 DNA-binding protein rap1 [Neolecta irregularis DAH-3]
MTPKTKPAILCPTNQPLSSTSDQKTLLFRSPDGQPLVFYLHQDVFGRQNLKTDIEINGGKTVNTLGFPGCIPIFDHLKKSDLLNNYTSYKWITDCLKARELLDMKPYQSEEMASTVKNPQYTFLPANISGPPKQSRIPFSKEEDQILISRITSATHATQGLKLFEEIAEEFPSHSAQSWRARWVKTLKPLLEKHKLSETVEADASPTIIRSSRSMRTQDHSKPRPAEISEISKNKGNKYLENSVLQEQLRNKHPRELHKSGHSHNVEIPRLPPEIDWAANNSERKNEGKLGLVSSSQDEPPRKKRKLSTKQNGSTSIALDEDDEMIDRLLGTEDRDENLQSPSQANPRIPETPSSPIRHKKKKLGITEVPSTPDRVLDTQNQNENLNDEDLLGISLDDPPFVEVVNNLWSRFKQSDKFVEGNELKPLENKDSCPSERSTHGRPTVAGRTKRQKSSRRISTLPEDAWIAMKANKYQLEEIDVVKALFRASGNSDAALVILEAASKGQGNPEMMIGWLIKDPSRHPQIWTDEEDTLIRQGDFETLQKLDRVHKGQLKNRRGFLEKFDQENKKNRNSSAGIITSISSSH